MKASWPDSRKTNARWPIVGLLVVAGVWTALAAWPYLERSWPPRYPSTKSITKYKTFDREVLTAKDPNGDMDSLVTHTNRLHAIFPGDSVAFSRYIQFKVEARDTVWVLDAVVHVFPRRGR